MSAHRVLGFFLAFFVFVFLVAGMEYVFLTQDTSYWIVSGRDDVSRSLFVSWVAVGLLAVVVLVLFLHRPRSTRLPRQRYIPLKAQRHV